MKLRWWNRNYVGTQFGGSLYSMCDPFFMLILVEALGPRYVVWDKAATIRFRRPGRGTVHATFHIPQERIDEIRAAADARRKDRARLPGGGAGRQGRGGRRGREAPLRRVTGSDLVKRTATAKLPPYAETRRFPPSCSCSPPRPARYAADRPQQRSRGSRWTSRRRADPHLDRRRQAPARRGGHLLHPPARPRQALRDQPRGQDLQRARGSRSIQKFAAAGRRRRSRCR